jgi:hypothetical protein
MRPAGRGLKTPNLNVAMLPYLFRLQVSHCLQLGIISYMPLNMSVIENANRICVCDLYTV